MGIADVVDRMDALSAALPADDSRRHFHDVYRRTTVATGKAVAAGHFLDPGWVEWWDAVFAELYLGALQAALSGGAVPGPWAVAFGACAEPAATRLPPLRLVLLGMNAHINYDLPQAIIGVVSSADFDDPALLRRREGDHRAIDEVLAARVPAEDRTLDGPRTLLDRALTPLNRTATRRLLRESREKV